VTEHQPGPGELNPGEQTIHVVVGSKKSGKSKYLRWLAAGYPYDQVHIDLHGLDEPADVGVRDSGVVRIDEVPERWPEHLRPEPGVPLVLYYRPDAGSPTLAEDVDRAIGLAYTHGRTLVMVHEWGEHATVHRTPPMTRRALSQGRGRQVPLLLAMHRPVNIYRMTWAQADVVVVFEVPVKSDRQEIAEWIGWDVADFSAACDERPPYGYLLFDRRQPPPELGQDDERLLNWPPLTQAELAEVLAPRRRRVQDGAL
jgi:hypothetical protein